jgi:hypothetical protein
VIQSKVLKNPKKKSKQTFIQKLTNKLYHIRSAIRRFFIYGNFAWGLCEWDYSSLLKIVRFFLIRMSHSLVNGVLQQDEKILKSVRICIKLLDRLIKDDYNYWTNKHSSRWPITQTTGSEEEKKDFLYSIYMDDKQRDRDSRLLFSIMDKYYKLWWD